MSCGELDFVATKMERKAPQRPKARTTGARFVGARLTCQQLVLPGLVLLAPPCRSECCRPGSIVVHLESARRKIATSLTLAPCVSQDLKSGHKEIAPKRLKTVIKQ